jgi:hypothetical protein
VAAIVSWLVIRLPGINPGINLLPGIDQGIILLPGIDPGI